MKMEQASFHGVQLIDGVVSQIGLLLRDHAMAQRLKFDTLNLQFYLEVLFKKDGQFFDRLMQVYLLKIKMVSVKQENSAYLASRVANDILSNE